MSYRYPAGFLKPGLNTLASATSGGANIYGGIWRLNAASAAQGAGTWSTSLFLYSTGYNSSGQLGLGNRTTYSSPKQIGALSNWSSTSCGLSYTIALKTDGTLWAWGANNVGQLGLGNRTDYSSPKQVGSLTNWSSVACGQTHTAAIKTNGTLWAWGENQWGQLGLDDQTNRSSPTQVGNLTTWSKVAAGRSFTVALKTDGTLWSWGLNQVGQLGLNNTTYYSSPKQIGALTTWSSVACGDNKSAAIKTDGTLWTWGYNVYGQLGLGNTTSYSSPKQVGSLTNWLKVSSGSDNSAAAIKTDGTLWSWGQNNAGQLGLGNTTDFSSPKQVGSLANWKALNFSGSGSFGAVTNNGFLYVCGLNDKGQLGTGNLSNVSSLTQVGSKNTWISVASGFGKYSVFVTY